MSERMYIPSRRRALELGAIFIERDLHRMRERAIENQRYADRTGVVHAIGTSHEGDLLKAVEWATAAATLRAMARQEKEE